MQEITVEQFTQEMRTFEGLCNKAQLDLQSYINGCEDEALKNKLEKRYKQFEDFVSYVCSETNFINAPASTKFHLCIPHGTLIHSNSVTKTLIKLNNTLDANIPLYKLITAGMFHDLGKHNDYIENQPTEKQKQYGYKANPPYLFNTENEYIEHEAESVYIISKFIDLDIDEFVAILYHNSPWDGVTKPAFKKNKLLTLLNYADYYSCLYLEDRPESSC